MEGQAVRLKEAVDRLKSAHRRQVSLLVAVRVLWMALALALAAAYADVLLALEDTPRLAVDILLIAAILAAAAVSYRWHMRAASAERRVARLIEQGRPDLGNDLTNALDFEARLESGPPKDLSEALMREEIARGAEQALLVRDFRLLRPSTLHQERRALLALAGAALLLAILFPAVVAAVVPRYLDPFGDHPPYSPTRLAVTPHAARVHYDDDVKIAVQASGRMPERVWLVLRNPNGKELASLPMNESNKGQYFQIVQDVKDDLEYFARIEGGRSTRHALHVIKTPLIENATVVYDYPSYTHKRPETMDLTEPHVLKGLPATQVTLTLLSNRPLKSGTIDVCGTPYTLTPGGEKAATVRFPLSRAGAFTASVTDVKGIESHRKLTGKVEILPDQKPQIAIVTPGMDSFATPDAQVPITVEANDDLGIENVTLIRSFNASKDASKPIYAEDGANAFVTATELIDLGDLGVRPGDTIDYYATATDSAPGAPHTVASTAFRLKIVSFDEFKAFMHEQTTARDLAEKYNLLTDALEALANAQEAVQKEVDELRKKLADTGALSPQEMQRLAELERQQAELAQQAQELANRLREQAGRPSLYDVEESYKESLKAVAGRLDEAVQSMQNSAENMKQAQQDGAQTQQDGAQAQQALAEASQSQRQALDSLGRGREQFEQEVASVNRDLENLYNLMQDVERFTHLYTEQKSLERQARTLQDKTQPAFDELTRMKEIAEEQAGVREALDRLKQDLREHAKPVEEESPQLAKDARDIAAQIESRGIEQKMGSASDHLSRGMARPGHQQASAARQEMEEMISFCETVSGNGSAEAQRLRPSMSRGMGNTMDQLAKSLGTGAAGYMGRGSRGTSGGSVPFGFYSNDMLGDKSEMPSGNVRHMAQNVGKPGHVEQVAPATQEQLSSQKGDTAFEGAGGERFMDEYRGLIEAYFKGLAQEGN